MTDTLTQSSTKTVAITGSSGMVGRSLRASLSEAGIAVKSIVRREPSSYDSEIQWDAESGFVNPDRLEGLDAVVHLAGESIAEGRWNDKKKRRIRESRIQGTTTLATTLAGLDKKPDVLVCASAIGFYGDRGDEFLDESAEAGEGFLADVCSEWEQACAPAAAAGIRVVNLRIGIVLDKSGGALAAMLLPFKLCVGGRMGSGRQYWSWIGLSDLVGIIEHAIATESLSGPVNAVSPSPATNLEFTKAMGRALGRPTVFPMPGFAAKLVLGEMAEALLLSSARVIPTKLTESGYNFHHTDLDAALAAALS